MGNKLIGLGLLGAILLTISIIETSDQTFAQTSITQPDKGIPKDHKLVIPRKTVEPFIFLKSRLVIPGVGIDPEARKRLEALPTDRVHVLLYLDHIPKQKEREQLRKKGIALLSYIHNNGWLASVPKDKLEEVAKTPPIRWVGEILPEDKISPYILEDNFGPWAINKDGTVTLIVYLYKDVSLDQADSISKKYRSEKTVKLTPINAFAMPIRKELIIDLAKEEIVQWIEQTPPPLTDTNDEARAVVGANTLQAPPYNLSGTGILVMVYDGGGITDSAHPDFGGRVTVGTADVGSPTSNHATHVGGTVGGNGNQSNGTYRGMAPNVSMVVYNYDFAGIVYYNNPGDVVGDFNESINNFSADFATSSTASNIAPNGYNCSWLGDYETTAQLVDQIVGGSLGRRFPIVWAAGNERGGAGGIPGACGIGYNTTGIPATAKNSVVVGATDSNDNAIMVFSSLGPTDDGRIRPDVVAPGCQNNTFFSTNFGAGTNQSTSIWSTFPTTSPNYPYRGMCGTSMATPAVSGSLALLFEVYRQNHTVEPLPSTWKAILIQTALDLDRSGNGSATNDGTDFVNGWGLINVTSSVNLIMNDTIEAPRIIENNITEHGETDYYNITVPANTTEIKVTLVWDDFPGVPNAGLKDLQNDLDLFLIDSLGGVHYPWLLNASNYTQAATTGIDDLNNVEQVRIYNASGLLPGTWQVVINGSEIPQPNQSYSLVATPNFLAPVHAVVLLLDTSGSMGWDPWGAYGVPENETRLYKAKQASYYFLDLLNAYKRDNTTFGVATFPSHPSTCPTSAAGEVVYPLTTVNNATKEAAKSTINSTTAEDMTPMAAGIETAQAILQLNAEDKTIVLLSDGYHNCPNMSFPMAMVNDTSIKIYTLAYGNTTEVNHALLQEISNATGAGGIGEGFYVAENTTLMDLIPIFKAVIADLLGLYSPVDPAVTVTHGEIKKHPVYITEHDDKISFSLSWGKAGSASPMQPPLQLKLITPGGEIIDPAAAISIPDIGYFSGATYQVYFVRGSYLKKPSRIGTWQLLVDAGNLQSGTKAVYHYSVLMESALRMDAYFDKPNYGTGEPVLVKLKLTEKNRPAALSKLTVKVRKPEEGLGNWYAKNKVTADQMSKISKDKRGEPLSEVHRKSLVLTEVLKVPFPSSTETLLELYDDGAHGDGAANDGVYANYFRDAKKEGIYTFAISAEGRTGKDNPYTRDKIIRKYVTVKVDPSSTQVKAEYDKSLKDGYAQYKVTMVPMDALGNYLGPGYSSFISFNTKDAQLVSPLVDNLDGSYAQYIKVEPARTKTISINIKGVEVKLEIKPERPFPIQWLALLIINLVIAIVLWRRFKT